MKPDSAGGFVDRRQVDRRFATVAPDYSRADFLAREVDRRMAERLDYVTLQPQRVLDLGCGSGASFAALRQRYPEARLLGLDRQPAMLRAARAAQPGNWRRWIPGLRDNGPQLLAADAAALPLASGQCSLIWSNLLLPWVDDPAAVLREALRLLEVGGLLMFASLGPDTLRELRGSFDDGYDHTQRFFDMHDLGDMLVEAGFADPVMDMEVLTLTYTDPARLFAELRAAGATCAMHGRRPGLTGRQGWQRMLQNYARQQRDGRYPATMEIIYGHAWKAA
ncbi:MAG: hypothetical protein RIR00_75, partial [Pseudomonadota bacterium]